jgi:hypothetical protein
MGYVYSLSDSDSLISLTGGYKLSCPWERQMSLKNTASFDVYKLNQRNGSGCFVSHYSDMRSELYVPRTKFVIPRINRL